jgi:LmbE family N-acetylglucosaminyl deacetylase
MPAEQNRALAIAAHPDDIEFTMSGTLLRLRAAGWEIHYMNVGTGKLGTNSLPAAEIIRLRREESLAACKLVGAVYHEPIADDLEIFYNQELLTRLAATVREVAPQIILTHYLQDYMEDHSITARLAVTAAFSRGMTNFQTCPSRPTTDQNVALYHAMPYGLCDPYGRPVTADFYVDITEQLETKVKMLACHRSQKEWLDVSQGQDSYLQTLRDMSAEMGCRSGAYKYAEGWTRHLHHGLGPADFDPLTDFSC